MARKKDVKKMIPVSKFVSPAENQLRRLEYYCIATFLEDSASALARCLSSPREA